MAEKALFILFGVLAVIGALATITRTNIIHGLIALIFTFVNVAMIYLVTQAYFLAVVQVMVYAGAILVLFTFVVMFLNLREFQQIEQLHEKQKWAALILGPIVLAEFVAVALGATWASARDGLTPEAIAAAGGNARVLGETLFNEALLPFEVASLILLVSMVGAIVLAKKEHEPFLQTREWDIAEEPVRELVELEV